MVEIEDPYKTLPYRGQQRFLSWLGFIWPSHSEAFYHSSTQAFPVIPDTHYPFDGLNFAQGVQWYSEEETGERISAFAPGVALTANSHQELHNIIPAARGENRFIAKKDGIAAGTELFLNYGRVWHEWRAEWEQHYSTKRVYETLQDYNRKMDFSNLPTQADKRAQMDETTRRKKKHVLNTDLHKPFGAVERNLPEEEEESTSSTTTLEETTKSLDWLQQHGYCVDVLQVGETDDDDDDEGAAFVTRAIRKGEIISPAPLLTLKRSDLEMYEFNQHEITYRNALNFDRLTGQEELLNLCYGHADSELLLLPYSPGVSFIRHASADQPANAEIRWSAGQEELLALHPIDVLELPGGQLRMEFVALRDLQAGEQVLVDFGPAYETAWNENDDFRHERRVPDDFYPHHWLHASVEYKVDLPKLQPGEMQPLVWKHNGKPVADAYRVGLPANFSQKVLQYSQELGIMDKFEEVLYQNPMESDDWYVFDAKGENNGEWFVQRFMSTVWNFNMHYIAMWSEAARKSFLRAMYKAGFQTALEAIGREFGLESLTCFHGSFMGISEADSSFTHTDIYATGGLGFNIIFPTVTVPDSDPELDIQSTDPNIVIRLNYEHGKFARSFG